MLDGDLANYKKYISGLNTAYYLAYFRVKYCTLSSVDVVELL